MADHSKAQRLETEKEAGTFLLETPCMEFGKCHVVLEGSSSVLVLEGSSSVLVIP